MRALLERTGGFLPTLLALTLPLLFLPSLSDSYILPRASLVIAGACLGVALAAVAPGGPGLGDWRWPLAGAAGAAMLALAFSVSWPLGLAGSYTRYESLPMRLAYLGLAAAAVWLIRTPRQRDAVGAALVLGTSIACLEALDQALGHAAFRPDGNLGNANLLAALVALAMPIAVDRGLRGTNFIGAWWGGVAVLGVGIFVTTSRSGAVAAVAGVLALAALYARGRLAAAAAAGWAVAMVVVVGFIQLTPLQALNDDPASLRLNLWRDGLGMIASRPLTGYGEDTTGLVFGRFLSHDYAGLVTFDRVHSGPLDIAATQGLIGLAALGAVLFVLGRAAWRARDRPGVRGLAAALAGYSVWVLFNFDWAPATGAFWLIAGTLWAACRMPAAATPAAATPRAYWWRPPVAVLLVAAAMTFAVAPALADYFYIHGRTETAVQIDPLQAQYWWGLAESDFGQGALRAGVAALQHATELGETDPTLYVQLGDRRLQLGDRDGARRAYERALEIDPYFTPARQKLNALGG
jgi:O-Antigen ligase